MPTSSQRPLVPYAVLLRGVNVGGKGRVPMPELRSLLSDLGYVNPRTYLNSGNLVLDSAPVDEVALGDTIAREIERHFGFPVACLARDGEHFRGVVADNPFATEAAADGSRVHVTFLSAPIPADRLAAVPASGFTPEDYRVGDRVLYLNLPTGIGRSKLAEALARPSVIRGISATTRNWNTVRQLATMTAAG